MCSAAQLERGVSSYGMLYWLLLLAPCMALPGRILARRVPQCGTSTSAGRSMTDARSPPGTKKLIRVPGSALGGSSCCQVSACTRYIRHMCIGMVPSAQYVLLDGRIGSLCCAHFAAPRALHFCPCHLSAPLWKRRRLHAERLNDVCLSATVCATGSLCDCPRMSGFGSLPACVCPLLLPHPRPGMGASVRVFIRHPNTVCAALLYCCTERCAAY